MDLSFGEEKQSLRIQIDVFRNPKAAFVDLIVSDTFEPIRQFRKMAIHQIPEREFHLMDIDDVIGHVQALINQLRIKQCESKSS